MMIALVFALLNLQAEPVAAASQDDRQVATEASAPKSPVVARAAGVIEGTGAPLAGPAAVVTKDQLDEVLIWREGRSPAGQQAFAELLQLLVVEAMGEEAGIVIGDEEMAERRRELDDEVRNSGIPGGIEELIEMQGTTESEFMRYLRLSMISERLARRALGVDETVEVPPEDQQAWLAQAIQSRETKKLDHPWSDGVVATSGGVTITRDEFAAHLRGQMPDEDVREACYMMLLERAVLARMPELGEAGIEAALDREVERRRAAMESDPQYGGATYENMLDARGLSIEAVRRDPAIRAAAFAHEAVDRAFDEDGIKEEYRADQQRYDAKFGEAVQVYVLYKAASDDPNNPLVPPAKVVMDDLAAMAEKIESRQEFLRALDIQSEDARSRENGGLLGILARHGEGDGFGPLRAAAFAAIDASPDTFQEQVLGPVRLETGCVLFMLGQRRPAPSWDEMREAVHGELRAKFLAESLSPAQVDVLLPRFQDAPEDEAGDGR